MRLYRFRTTLFALGLALAVAIALPFAFQPVAHAQATNVAGAIQGTITDQNGAALPGAQVVVTEIATGLKKTLVTDTAGFYSVPSLVPGRYQVVVSDAGFSNATTIITVQIGNTSAANIKLKVGNATENVVVSSEALQVNTVQSTVQGVLGSQAIDNLPISGRNFLDLSQLQPGVQIQDGSGFDPTKGGYSSVSFNGVNGRAARILLDGQDISDETVGTTILNVSAGSIDEFQVSRSSLDISNELTSSGAVTVSTRSGANGIHGQAFGLLRDQRAGDALQVGGADTYFQREQFGIRAGGPFIKDKAFFFGDSERAKQDSANPYLVPAPFDAFSGSWSAPYRDTYSVGRIDYNAPKSVHLFFRGAYENNLDDSNFGEGYARYGNKDNTPIWAGGADFQTGKYTHSIRASYLKFHNLIVDESAGLPNPMPGAYLTIHNLRTGPNVNAPQQTFQSDKQLRYDGGVTVRAHQFQYGLSLNRILGGGLAAFFNYGPEVSGTGTFQPFYDAAGDSPNGMLPDCAATPTPSLCVNGGSHKANDPTAYPAYLMEMGNGQGYGTERPGFGMPGGGQEDWRFGIYFGDTWKVSRVLTVNYGLRYSRDTGRSNADLAPVPCSDAVAAWGGASPCTTGNLLDALTPGLGGKIRQPNTDFGPKAGFAWDVKGNGKTVVRGGFGIYFENNIFNNAEFDRETRLPQGLFFAATQLQGTPSFKMPDGTAVSSVTCPDGASRTLTELWTDAMSISGPCFIALQQEYQTKTAALGASSNANYMANALTESAATTDLFIYAPNYRTPRSLQLNIGVQRELWKGAIFSADYVRNVGTHVLQGVDENHVGDAGYLNTEAATHAINATTANYGGSIDTAIAAGATIDDFAGNGLDSGNVYLNGYPAGAYSQNGITIATGAAFAGKNPYFGQMTIIRPMGRSVYNGLQLSLQQQSRIPLSFVKGTSYQLSYSFSRFLTSAGGSGAAGQANAMDQNFSPSSWDNNHPLSYMGPGGLDRRQQISYGGNITWIGDVETNFIGHYYTPLSSTLYLSDTGDPVGEIFRSDVTGDGSTEDIVPGLKPGAFMRGVNQHNIAQMITNYNATAAGKLTPAGQALVNAGLFTTQQLIALGATTRSIGEPILNNVGNDGFKSFDLVLARPVKVARLGESFSIDPSVSFFNLFNFANFNDDGNTILTGELGPSPLALSATGTNSSVSGDPNSRNTLRTGNGSGVFGQGTSRVIEYGLKVNF